MYGPIYPPTQNMDYLAEYNEPVYYYLLSVSCPFYLNYMQNCVLVSSITS